MGMSDHWWHFLGPTLEEGSGKKKREKKNKTILRMAQARTRRPVFPFAGERWGGEGAPEPVSPAALGPLCPAPGMLVTTPFSSSATTYLSLWTWVLCPYPMAHPLWACQDPEPRLNSDHVSQGAGVEDIVPYAAL